MLISIIVPVYKKERTIQNDLKNIVDVMTDTRFEYEVIVVIDGYLDNSRQLSEEVMAEVKAIPYKYANLVDFQVVGYEKNIGKGNAIKYGAQFCNGDYIAFIDAGSKINTIGISMILEHLFWYKADIIVGSKRHPASQVQNYSWTRRLYSFGYQLLVLLLFRLRIRDTQAGLKVYRKEIIDQILPKLVVKQYAFDIELLAVARYHGYKRIFEAPIEIDFDVVENNSRFTKFLFMDPMIRNMMIDTMAVFYRMYILKHYDDKPQISDSTPDIVARSATKEHALNQDNDS